MSRNRSLGIAGRSLALKSRLLHKIDAIRSNPGGREFILADARDADMAWGIPSFGTVWPAVDTNQARLRTLPEFLEQIRKVIEQGVVDILLASVSLMDRLAHGEHLFEKTDVTPAIRANDSTDVWCQRGARYREFASLPFASAFIHEAQYGSLTAEAKGEPVVNLGLYSVTFNNQVDPDRQHLEAFRAFRAEAQKCGFNYFLEVFAPNVDAGVAPEMIPAFVNDHVTRMLAAVPSASRPLFLKVPYFGPQWMEELAAYDPSLIVGIMGGSSGTTYDSLSLLAAAQKYGARAALFGRRIKDAEDPLSFIAAMRHVVNGDSRPEEAVRWYHGELQRRNIPARRPIDEDTQRGQVEAHYASSR
jgi:hypothetical protein